MSAEVIYVPRFRYCIPKMDWVTEDGANVKEGMSFSKWDQRPLKRKEKMEKDIERETAEYETESKEHENLLKENKLKDNYRKIYWK